MNADGGVMVTELLKIIAEIQAIEVEENEPDFLNLNDSTKPQRPTVPA